MGSQAWLPTRAVQMQRPCGQKCAKGVLTLSALSACPTTAEPRCTAFESALTCRFLSNSTARGTFKNIELKPYCQQEMIWLAPNETLLRYAGRAYCQPCVLQSAVEVAARFCGAAVAHLCVDRRQRRMLSCSGTNRTTRHWTHCSHRKRQRKRKRQLQPKTPNHQRSGASAAYSE
jgi:hypothetical protein